MADVYNLELKPCPFCGGQAKLCSTAAGTRFVFWVRCDFMGDSNCDVIPNTPKFDTAEQAVNAWNMRSATAMQNTVDHPKHYIKEGHKECISEMVEKYGIVPVYWFCMLNAYKYEYRAGLKGDAETDLQKAKWYRNYACKLMDEASTKCCNMKTIPIECYNELKKKLKETT